MPTGVSHEHIVSYYSLFKLLPLLKKEGWFDTAKRDGDNRTSIHWALRRDAGSGDASDIACRNARNIAFRDARDTVDRLRELNADVNAQDREDHTPLHYAAHVGNQLAVQLLVEHKADVNLVNKDNESPLITACRKHHEPIVLCLLEAGADVRIQSSFGTALQVISLIGCCDCAPGIIKQHGKRGLREMDQVFGTPLHAAAFHGHLSLVKLLCKEGAKVRTASKTYGSPLTAATAGACSASSEHPLEQFLAVTSELLRRGVNINDSRGTVGPALRVAAENGNEAHVKFLLENGAMVSKAKGFMGTPYEAANERGHEEVKKLLEKKDPMAASYGGMRPSRNVRQQLQQKVFKATIARGNQATIKRLIDEFEVLFEKQIRKGETPFLRMLAELGGDCFQDVVMLLTAAKSSHRPPEIERREAINASPETPSILRKLGCINLSATRDSLSPGTRSKTPIFRLDRTRRTVSTTFARDKLGDDLLPILDSMTETAVKTLVVAIKTKDTMVVKLVADRWIEVLNTVVSDPRLGEEMLKNIVQKRADELKGHLTNHDLDEVEGLEKAKALASVGIELLLAAIERRIKFKHLLYVISKIWIRAVIDVHKIGEKGEGPVRELISLFAQRMRHAIETEDEANTRVYGVAGIELVRALAWSRETELLDTFSKQLVILVELTLKSKYARLVEEWINQGLKECQECLQTGKHEEAASLTLASLAILHHLVEKDNLGKVRVQFSRNVLQAVVSGCQLPRTVDDTPSAQVKHEPEEAQAAQDAILEAALSLFVVAEILQPGRLDELALAILDRLSVWPAGRIQ